jgi:hypothetical protein
MLWAPIIAQLLWRLNKVGKSFYLKFLILFLIIFGSSNVFAKEGFLYKIYEEKTGLEIGKFDLIYDRLSSRQTIVKMTESFHGNLKYEEYVLDQNDSTLVWKSTVLSERTDIFVKRYGLDLIFSGQFHGKVLNKTIKIDERALIINPKLGLKSFALSNKRKISFWGIRQDTLEVFELTAKKKKTEMIVINGEAIEAVRIEWGAPGLFKRFFHRVYWFALSNGQYLKQKGSNGVVKELVGQKG